MKTIANAAVSVALLVGGFAASARAGQKTARPRRRRSSNRCTALIFIAYYCATCHGRDGKGNGPAAERSKCPVRSHCPRPA